MIGWAGLVPAGRVLDLADGLGLAGGLDVAGILVSHLGLT
jgi:hypothetical protein